MAQRIIGEGPPATAFIVGEAIRDLEAVGEALEAESDADLPLIRSMRADVEAQRAKVAALAAEREALDNQLAHVRARLRALLHLMTPDDVGGRPWFAVPPACRATVSDILSAAVVPSTAPNPVDEVTIDGGDKAAEEKRLAELAASFVSMPLPKRFRTTYEDGPTDPVARMMANTGDAEGGSTREPRLHALKLDAFYFADVLEGRKNFEIRQDDRGVLVGDVLRLAEHGPSTLQTGRVLYRRVIYRSTFAQVAGWVVLGLSGSGPALELRDGFSKIWTSAYTSVPRL